MKIKTLLSAALLACSLVSIAQEQVLDDFESGALSFSTKNGEMGNFTYEVVENPGKTGINTSNYALKFKRTVANTPAWGGFWFDLKEELRTIVKPQDYRYAHVKYYRTDNLSTMKLKIEQSATGKVIEVASKNAPQEIYKWEDIVFDFEGGVGPYARLVIMPDFLTERPAGIEVYIDDIRFNNDPNPLQIFEESRLLDVTATDISYNEIQLSWAPLTNATSYLVKLNCVDYQTVTEPRITIPALNANTEYKITVEGINAEGTHSLPSDLLTVNTLPTGKLDAVTGLVNMDKIIVETPPSDTSHPQGWKYVQKRYQDKLALQWNPVYKATAYEIYKDGQKVAETADTTYDLTGLSPYTIYKIQVRAINANGDKSDLTPEKYYRTDETREQRDQRMAWWRESRFGMMITWGVHSAYAGEYNGKRADKHNGEGQYSEWIMFSQNIPVADYKAKATEFTCENYDPEAWMKAAADAGMKYLVFISKHHDGFALWDSKASDWNAAKASGAKRDVMKPLIEAARKNGMKIGIYYSQCLDWGNEGGMGWTPQINNAPYYGHWPADMKQKYVDEVCVPQIDELMNNYGDIDIFWWDMGVNDMTLEQEQQMLSAIYKSKNGSRIILNNRLRFDGSTPGDHETPEQSIPGVPATGYADARDWETCMTMNDNWGYSKHDDEWKTPTDVIHKLIDIASKGGNFLLNVGPKADGSFPQQSSDILAEVKGFMNINAEAIHGTLPCPIENGVPFGRVTHKKDGNKNTLYLHVFDWPTDGKLTVKGLYNEGTTATLLEGGTALTTTVGEQGIVINIPAEAPNQYSTTIKLIVNGDLDMHHAPVVQEANGMLTLLAETSLLAPESGICLEAKEGIPNLGCWVGVPANQETIQWYVKINKPGTFNVQGDVASFQGGKFQFIAGAEESEITFTGTGGWNAENFKMIDMGQVKITTTGTQYIELKTVADGWNPLGLRKLVLTPEGGVGMDEISTPSISYHADKGTIICSLSSPQSAMLTISLYNVQGKLVAQQNATNIDSGESTYVLNTMHPGCYLLRVTLDDKVFVEKVNVF